MASLYPSMSQSPKLAQVGELFLLERIRGAFFKRSKSVHIGIGDDAAALRVNGKYLLATSDMMVEGVHFDPAFITPYQLGFKLISVNVSDVYAMGGEPSYCLLNMALNKYMHLKFVDNFFEGVRSALRLYGAQLVGGDLSSTNNGISLSATLLGFAGKCIRRSGANFGDRIYVTGNLGDSACGLEILKRLKRPVPLEVMNSSSKKQTVKKRLLGLRLEAVEPLLRRHLMPEARNPKKFVAAASAMIDISDGLLIDLSRLCNESNVGVRIYEQKIPLSPQLKEVASFFVVPPTRLAFSGGEDYELLFTAPPGKEVQAIYIGDVIRAKRVIVDKAGREKAFSAEGYEHFG